LIAVELQGRTRHQKVFGVFEQSAFFRPIFSTSVKIPAQGEEALETFEASSRQSNPLNIHTHQNVGFSRPQLQ
jgi:hypothetical protein